MDNKTEDQSVDAKVERILDKNVILVSKSGEGEQYLHMGDPEGVTRPTQFVSQEERARARYGLPSQEW